MATTTLAARVAPRPAPWVTALAGLVTLGVAMGIGRFAFTPILPMMQQDAAVSVAVGGWLASANYLGYLLGAISAVALRARATTIVRAGLVAIALVTVGMGTTGSFPAWLLLRALAGVASAWVLVFASAWALGRLGAAERPVLRGAVFGGVGAGIAAAGLRFARMATRAERWHRGGPPTAFAGTATRCASSSATGSWASATSFPRPSCPRWRGRSCPTRSSSAGPGRSSASRRWRRRSWPGPRSAWWGTGGCGPSASSSWRRAWPRRCCGPAWAASWWPRCSWAAPSW